MIKSTNETLKPYQVVGRGSPFGPRKTVTHYPELQSIPPNPRSSTDKDIQ